MTMFQGPLWAIHGSLASWLCAWKEKGWEMRQGLHGGPLDGYVEVDKKCEDFFF